MGFDSQLKLWRFSGSSPSTAPSGPSWYKSPSLGPWPSDVSGGDWLAMTGSVICGGCSCGPAVGSGIGDMMDMLKGAMSGAPVLSAPGADEKKAGVPNSD